MILTGSEIRQEVKNGRIFVEPFNETCLNPNSYNYHLGKRIKIAPLEVIDPKQKMAWNEIEIPEEGLILQPNYLYLGHTLEKIGSSYFVTSLIGRSSIGRLGLYLQLSADLGQLGAIHRWTLEMTVIQPLRIYKGMIVGQVSFWKPIGKIISYNGEYGNVSTPGESKIF